MGRFLLVGSYCWNLVEMKVLRSVLVRVLSTGNICMLMMEWDVVQHPNQFAQVTLVHSVPQDPIESCNDEQFILSNASSSRLGKGK
jgi:hypothetical protein